MLLGIRVGLTCRCFHATYLLGTGLSPSMVQDSAASPKQAGSHGKKDPSLPTTPITITVIGLGCSRFARRY